MVGEKARGLSFIGSPGNLGLVLLIPDPLASFVYLTGIIRPIALPLTKLPQSLSLVKVLFTMAEETCKREREREMEEFNGVQ